MTARALAALSALLLAAPLTLGAAAWPIPTAGLGCTLLPWLCPEDDEDESDDPEEQPTPDPSADPDESGDSADDKAQDDDETTAPTPSPTPTSSPDPVDAPVDDGAPVFSGTPAAMGAGGLSFTGLKEIGIVSVPTVTGDSVRALKISADSITITDFSLTVRPPDGPGLVTDADTMSLKGHVTVYLGSLSATPRGGDPITIGTDTPPALDVVEPGLLEVSMGLVGTLADSISYSNTDQRIVEDE